MSYRRNYLRPKLKRLKPKKAFFKKPVFWVILVFAFLLIGLYFLVFYGKIQVSKIEIFGNETISNQEIEKLAWLDIEKKFIDLGILKLSSKSIILVSKNKLSKNILNKMPAIEEVKMKKKLPSFLSISIKERKPAAIFCSKDLCFLMDMNGIIFKETETNNQNLIIIRSDNNYKELSLGINAIEKSSMDIVYSIQKSLENNFQVGVREVMLSDVLVFKTYEGWDIYFDSKADINHQINKMNALLKEEISAEARKKLQYIYLQYKDKAYYK